MAEGTMAYVSAATQGQQPPSLAPGVDDRGLSDSIKKPHGGTHHACGPPNK